MKKQEELCDDCKKEYEETGCPSCAKHFYADKKVKKVLNKVLDM